MPTTGFLPKVKRTATGCNMPSPRHSGNQDEAVHPANGTHLVILEFEDWEDYINAGQALDEASRSLFGRSYAEVAADEYVPMRDLIRREFYLSPPESM